jgi:16S rRNA (guanine527-N7)-methyltransferase
MKTPRGTKPGPDDLLVAGALSLGLHITAGQVAAFGTYLREITRWSARMNLTALRGPDDIIRGGFLDSLACLPLIPRQAKHILDVGSGAGFPGLPLKLIRTDLLITLVEASRRKATFLRHMVRLLGATGVRVVQRRAEELAGDPEEAAVYDLALARAVAPPLDQGCLVRPFLRSGGLFLLQIGPGPLATGTPERLVSLGFNTVQELALPVTLGGPGRRVLVLRRADST